MDVFSPFLGFSLIIAVSFWHAKLIGYSLRFQQLFSARFQAFTFATCYAGLEFLQRQIPFIKEWWFVPYAKSSWAFSEILGLLGVGGVSLLSFVLVLTNLILANVFADLLQRKKQELLAQKPNFILWSENEFMDAEDKELLDILKGFSNKANAHLIVDTFLHQDTKLYDVALLISPSGKIERAKLLLFSLQQVCKNIS